MPVIRIAEIPNAGPRAVGASSANIGVPRFGGMAVEPEVAQLSGAAALDDTSIRRGAQSMLTQTLEQDAFTAEAEAGIRLGKQIGAIGYMAEQVAEKFGKAKDTADLARAETIMRSAFEKQQNEQLDLPADKWEENWTRNLDQTRKALSEIKISNNAAAELTPSWQRWSDLSVLQIRNQARKKQIEGFQMDVDANAMMRIADDDLTGAFAIYDRAEKDGIFDPEESKMRKARIYDDQIRKAKEDNLNRLTAGMNAEPEKMLPLFERRSRGEDVPELGDITPMQATTLANNAQSVLRGRIADADDAADQAILTGQVKTKEDLRKQFPNLPERRLLTHEATMQEVFQASPEGWAKVAAARPSILASIETYDSAKDDQEMSRYFAVKDRINREMPAGERQEFLEMLSRKRRDGNKVPPAMQDGLATLEELNRKNYFGKVDEKKLESDNAETRAEEARKYLELGNKYKAAQQQLTEWAKQYPDQARDREKVLGQLKIIVSPAMVDQAAEVFQDAGDARDAATVPAASIPNIVPGLSPVPRASASDPATMRHNNPGAMWYVGGWQKKYGASFGQKLNDGLGQGNQIARFPTPVHGAAAQFHLLSNYGGTSVRQGIAKWSGNNNVSSYLSVLRRNGFDPSEKLSSILSDPESAVRFAKAMASHETGKGFPLADEEWMAAYDMFRSVKGV